MSWVVGLAFTATNLSSLQAQPRPQPTQVGDMTADSLLQSWMDALDSPSFAEREVAFWRLQQIGPGALPLIEDRIQRTPILSADRETRLIRLLSELAADPETNSGDRAFELLQSLAKNDLTYRGQSARNAVRDISEQQKVVYQEMLQQMGGLIQVDPKLQLVTTNRTNLPHLRVDGYYRGTDELLRSVRWIDGLTMAILEGPRVNRKWIEAVAEMPDLQILQIKRAKIAASDLRILQKKTRLEIVELIYVDIDDSAVDELVKLPIWSTLRVFGTKITPQGHQRLNQYMEEVDIVFGRGAHLGVSVSGPDDLIIGQVTPGGAAHRHGLQSRDKLLSVDGRSLKVFEDLRRELSAFAPGDIVKIGIERRDHLDAPHVLEIDVTLGEQQ
jgi:hypothetical protein